MNITGTPKPSATPPSVFVDVSAIPAGALTYTVTRTVGGVSSVLRGASAATVLGTSGGTADYEAPFGLPIIYSVVAYGSGGAVLGSAQSAQVLLDVDVMWISDPLSPASSAPCRGVKSPESFQTLTYVMTTATTPTEGARMPTGLSGVRQAASGVPLTIIAQGAAEAAPIRQVLLNASPFLLRLPVGWQVPLPAMPYCLAQQVQDSLFGGLYGRTHLTTSFDVVQPPGVGIAVPLRSYATVLAEGTYADIRAAHVDYLALLRGA